MADRLTDVLDAVHAAIGTGWNTMPGANGLLTGLPEAAIEPGQLPVDLMPGEPEARGLLALMLFRAARQQARRAANGDFVPLAAQHARLWDRDRIIRADLLLARAARSGRFGRSQCKATIRHPRYGRPGPGVRGGRNRHQDQTGWSGVRPGRLVAQSHSWRSRKADRCAIAAAAPVVLPPSTRKPWVSPSNRRSSAGVPAAARAAA